MALLHATQLYNGHINQVFPTVGLIYTVPAGERIILRSVAVHNPSGSASVNVFVYVAGNRVWSTTLAASGSAEWRPWVVASAGQQLWLSCSAAAGFDTVVSGSIYTV